MAKKIKTMAKISDISIPVSGTASKKRVVTGFSYDDVNQVLYYNSEVVFTDDDHDTKINETASFELRDDDEWYDESNTQVSSSMKAKLNAAITAFQNIVS